MSVVMKTYCLHSILCFARMNFEVFGDGGNPETFHFSWLDAFSILFLFRDISQYISLSLCTAVHMFFQVMTQRPVVCNGCSTSSPSILTFRNAADKKPWSSRSLMVRYTTQAGVRDTFRNLDLHFVCAGQSHSFRGDL